MRAKNAGSYSGDYPRTGEETRERARERTAHRSSLSPGLVVARDCPKAERRLGSALDGGLLAHLGLRGERCLRGVCYYPYYFQSWRVTVPKSLKRVLKVRLFTGVNAISRSAGPASGLPETSPPGSPQRSEDPAATLTAELEPLVPADEARRLGREYLDGLIRYRYRPTATLTIEGEDSRIVYVPYYAYAAADAELSRAALIEGLTGARGRVRDLPEVHRALVAASGGAGNGSGAGHAGGDLSQ